jgi:hypothetical protein
MIGSVIVLLIISVLLALPVAEAGFRGIIIDDVPNLEELKATIIKGRGLSEYLSEKKGQGLNKGSEKKTKGQGKGEEDGCECSSDESEDDSEELSCHCESGNDKGGKKGSSSIKGKSNGEKKGKRDEGGGGCDSGKSLDFYYVSVQSLRSVQCNVHNSSPLKGDSTHFYLFACIL